MHGYGSHTYRWVNKNGEAFWVKFHFVNDTGVKNLDAEQANKLKSEDPDYATRDLFDHIRQGKSATWTFNV